MGRPLDPETLVYGFSLASDPQVAPDGDRVVFALTSTDRATKKATSHLWLRDLDGANPRRLTWSGERNGGARWSPDGRRIAFVSDRVKKSGLFVLSLDGGEARELGRHSQPISNLAWSPDGATIAYNATFDPENPDEVDLPAGSTPRVRITSRLDYKADGRGYVGDARQQVFVVDVSSGERRRLTSDPFDHATPQWSPDGRTLAAQRTARGGAPWAQLALIDAASGEIRLAGPDACLSIGVWGWSPAGDRIALAGDTASTGQFDLFIYDVMADTIRRVTDDLPCQPDVGFPGRIPPSHPVWLDDRRVLFHAIRAGASGLYAIDVESGAVETLADWTALNSGLSVDAARRYAAQAHSSLAAFGEIGITDLQTGATWLATDESAPVLAEAPAARWERLEVRRGEFVIDAWLLRPPDVDPSKRYPVVLDVHGGPQAWHGYAFSTFQQCLATNGFLVVYANPRGSGSYGRRFTQQVIEDWGGEDYLDLMAVVDAVAGRPEADPGRIGIYGGSYGGYMTAWAITQTDRFKAAVPVAGVFDLESFYGTSDIGYFFGDIHAGGPPHARRDWYAAHSPAAFAHRVRTPTLIVHGEADERCPIGQAEQMFVTLAKAGCEVEFARYPGGDHNVPRFGPPAHTEDFLRRVLAWFKRHLGEPQ
jgi:dipeptidyl aminopeptidase/acylaminoacyl peptidase